MCTSVRAAVDDSLGCVDDIMFRNYRLWRYPVKLSPLLANALPRSKTPHCHREYTYDAPKISMFIYFAVRPDIACSGNDLGRSEKKLNACTSSTKKKPMYARGKNKIRIKISKSMKIALGLVTFSHPESNGLVILWCVNDGAAPCKCHCVSRHTACYVDVDKRCKSCLSALNGRGD